MSRLRPLNVRRRKPTWLYDDDVPPPLGSLRARQEAQAELLNLYDEQEEEDNGRASPSYHRPYD